MKATTSAFVLFFSFLTICGFAGHEKNAHGGRSAAMSFTDVCLKDFWSLRNNQAGLAWIKAPAAGIYYENRFGLKELGFQSAGFVYPFSFGTIGITADYFGDENYNEMTAGLAWGMKLHEKLSAGIQLDYLSTFINLERFNKASTVTFEIGLLYQVNDEIWVGMHVYNPIQQEMKSEAYEKVPAVFSFGALFEVSDKLIFTGETEKITDKKESFHIGAEYEILKDTYARVGISTRETLFSFGFETNVNSLKLQLASSMHQSLGFSPMASIVYQF